MVYCVYFRQNYQWLKSRGYIWTSSTQSFWGSNLTPCEDGDKDISTLKYIMIKSTAGKHYGWLHFSFPSSLPCSSDLGCCMTDGWFWYPEQRAVHHLYGLWGLAKAPLAVIGGHSKESFPVQLTRNGNTFYSLSCWGDGKGKLNHGKSSVFQ